MAHQTDITVINGLIAATLDSAYGYEEAMQDTPNHSFCQIFAQRAEERHQVVQQLRQFVIAQGGTPADDGTVLGSIHRSWTNLKTSLTNSERSLINEVERGEDHVKHKFENALADETLSAEARSVVQATYGTVKAGHDQISGIKHDLQNRAA